MNISSDKQLIISKTVVISGLALFVAIVLSLQHVQQPAYDYRTQMMSELALGEYGQWMLLAFLAVASAVVATAWIVRKLLLRQGILYLLLLAALNLAIAGIVTLSDSTDIHALSVCLAFIFCGLSMYMIPTNVPDSYRRRCRIFSWSVLLLIILPIALAGQTILPIGIAQRLATMMLFVWLLGVTFDTSRFFERHKNL